MLGFEVGAAWVWLVSVVGVWDVRLSFGGIGCSSLAHGHARMSGTALGYRCGRRGRFFDGAYCHRWSMDGVYVVAFCL